MANNASIRSTASVAIGALFNRAGSKNLRRACAQHRCLDIGPWLAVGFVEPVEARIGDRATSETTVPGCVAAATIRCFSALGHRRRRCTDVGTSTCVLESVVDCRSCRHNRPQGAYDASLSSALWSRVQVDLSPPALGRGPSSLCRRRRAASHDLRCVGRSAGPGSVPAAGKVPAEAGKARCGFPGGLSTGASTKAGPDQRGPEATARGLARCCPSDGGWLLREPSGFFEERAGLAELDGGRAARRRRGPSPA
jgi:hypothetical protein